MKQKKQVGENKTEGKEGGRGASQTESRLWRKKKKKSCLDRQGKREAV